MDERTILITENVSYEELRQHVLQKAESLRAVLVRTRLLPGWPKSPLGFEVIHGESLYEPCDSQTHIGLHHRFSEVYSAVIGDVRSLFIAERTWVSSVTAVEGAFKNAARLSTLCWNVLALLDRTQATRVVCTSSPHEIADWVTAKVADFLGIPVFIVGASPVPWKAWCMQGLDELRPIGPDELQCDGTPMGGVDASDVEGIQRYLAVNRDTSYIDAVPAIDRPSQEDPARLSSEHLYRMSIFSRRLGLSMFDPRKVAFRYLTRRQTTLHHRQLFRRYNELARPLETGPPIVSMFLHYQPERTTMPEGGDFSNQLAAVYTLHSVLPDGWRLAVREHPATFYGPGPYRRAFRDPIIYDALDSLPNASLVPMSTTPFELIDSSQLVVTVTGTVGMQSLCRGVPVLALGAATYRDAPGALALPREPAEQVPFLQAALPTIAVIKRSVDHASLLKYLEDVATRSIGFYQEADEAPGSGESAPTFASRAKATALLVP